MLICKGVSIGQTFGRLVTTGERQSAGRAFRIKCICDCGTEKFVLPSSLRSGKAQSCGCLQRELASARRIRHGYTVGGRSRSEYNTWHQMIRRCYDPNNDAYEKYGGRGITVCDRWRFGDGEKSGFECFILDMGDKPSPTLTLERRENNGPYSKENCDWATRAAQSVNRRNTLTIDWRGETLPLLTACRREGIRYGLVKGRLQAGWSVARAMTEPPDENRRVKR